LPAEISAIVPAAPTAMHNFISTFIGGKLSRSFSGERTSTYRQTVSIYNQFPLARRYYSDYYAHQLPSGFCCT